MKKIAFVISAAAAVVLMQGCAASGISAARYWDGHKFLMLEDHWGEPTERQEAEDGSYRAIFRAGEDCTATFYVNQAGIITSHNFVGQSCSFDAYNRLKNIEH